MTGEFISPEGISSSPEVSNLANRTSEIAKEAKTTEETPENPVESSTSKNNTNVHNRAEKQESHDAEKIREIGSELGLGKEGIEESEEAEENSEDIEGREFTEEEIRDLSDKILDEDQAAKIAELSQDQREVLFDVLKSLLELQATFNQAMLDTLSGASKEGAKEQLNKAEKDSDIKKFARLFLKIVIAFLSALAEGISEKAEESSKVA